MIPTQGTVLAEALAMARQSFNTKETKYKSIVLISDGEDHDEQALSEVKKAVDEGIMINTVGVGSAEGAAIWDAEKNENKKDADGNDIISKLNEAELQSIAQSGQGIYQHLTNTESVSQAIAAQINTIEQKNFGDSLFVDYNSYYQYFLLICLLLLLIDLLIQPGKKLSAA
jgi:Ca-activated chloride channel family protein